MYKCRASLVPCGETVNKITCARLSIYALAIVNPFTHEQKPFHWHHHPALWGTNLEDVHLVTHATVCTTTHKFVAQLSEKEQLPNGMTQECTDGKWPSSFSGHMEVTVHPKSKPWKKKLKKFYSQMLFRKMIPQYLLFSNIRHCLLTLSFHIHTCLSSSAVNLSLYCSAKIFPPGQIQLCILLRNITVLKTPLAFPEAKAIFFLTFP